MGTRHLIAVYKDGEYKVAQYGQWDGYPSGQGVIILNFLSSMDRHVFEEKLKQVSFATQQELLDQWVECGADPNEGWVTMGVARRHMERYPENNRDTGADILRIIYESQRPLKLKNSIDFSGDSLFCEWGYVIDLDRDTLEVYRGFNKEPLDKSERFYTYFKERTGQVEQYYPIKKIAEYSLSSLPTEEEFVRELEPPRNKDE